MNSVLGKLNTNNRAHAVATAATNARYVEAGTLFVWGIDGLGRTANA
jgi:hypothetical protein